MKKILTIVMICVLCFSMFSILALQIKAGGVTSYPWPMFHHDSMHTGLSSSSAPETNDVLWTFQTGDRIVSSPAVADGRLFVGSMDNKIYALDQFSGAQVWSSLLGSPIWGSPAVDNGKVFVNDWSNLYALDEATGAITWHYSFGPTEVLASSPVVRDGLVFIGSNGGGVTAFNEGTGSVVWNFGQGIKICSTPAVADGKVFAVGLGPREVYALDEFTGELVWSRDVSAISDGSFFSSPAVADGKVFVGLTGIGGPWGGTVVALNENDGQLVWSQQLGDSVFSSPAVAYGSVFIGCMDHKIYALNEANGALEWTYTTGDEIELSSPAVADGKVFVGSDDHNVYALDAATGTKMWNYATGGGVWSSPAIADGAVYVGSMGGKVYAFGARAQVDGVETVLTLNDYRFKWSQPTFTIQQNFWIAGGKQLYWTQNIVLVFNHVKLMRGLFSLYNYTSGQPVLIRTWTGIGIGAAKNTITMRSVIQNGQLVMTNDFSSLTWSIPAEASEESRILVSDTLSGWLPGWPEGGFKPEIVLVGRRSLDLSPIRIPITIIGHVDFLPPTNGHVETYLRTKDSGTWVHGLNTVIDSPSKSNTLETSSGLVWTTAGDFTPVTSPATSNAEGLKFIPDYARGTVIPPTG